MQIFRATDPLTGTDNTDSVAGSHCEATPDMPSQFDNDLYEAPVDCAAGRAVLHVIRKHSLQDKASKVGAALLGVLHELKTGTTSSATFAAVD